MQKPEFTPKHKRLAIVAAAGVVVFVAAWLLDIDVDTDTVITFIESVLPQD